MQKSKQKEPDPPKVLVPLPGDLTVDTNVSSRLVWGCSIVRRFAEIIQHPLSSFGGAELCEVARPKKKSENH